MDGRRQNYIPPTSSGDNNTEFGPVIQKEMPFKDISFLELWWSLCSAELKHLCNFGRGHFEEQIILCNYFVFGPVVQVV